MDHKTHLARVRKANLLPKRPAAAKQEVQKRPAAGAEASPRKVFKENALGFPPSSEHDVFSEAHVSAPVQSGVSPVSVSEVAAAVADLARREALLAFCRNKCEDPPRKDLSVDQAYVKDAPQGPNRKSYIYQIQSRHCMKVFGQTTDLQFAGSKKEAKAAAEILCQLWNEGASQRDLQRCKLAGCFGCPFGRKLKEP